MSKVRVSEIFSSFQGEGRFTGKPSLWVRLFACNLKCDRIRAT
jgi:7-carboxy-7-deazaguanine synthase